VYTLFKDFLNAAFVVFDENMPPSSGVIPAMLFLLFFVNAMFDVELVHVSSVVPNDHAIDNQGPLSAHPETEWPAKEVEAKVASEIAHNKSHNKPDGQQNRCDI
jgi:hypothetical protein